MTHYPSVVGKRRFGRVVSERNPYGGPDLTWLGHDADTPLSPRGRVIFFAALLAIVAVGFLLLAVSLHGG